MVRVAGRHDAALVPVGSGSRTPRRRDGRPRPRAGHHHTASIRSSTSTRPRCSCHVQAGLTGLGLEKVLSPRGLSMGDYPPSILGSTIGGLVAVRTPGKSSARHGFLEDAVVGVSAVLADGRTIHTRVAPRRATGPDLARALCGSEGTLGFITSVVLRIHRRPEARFLAAFVLPSIDAAVAATYLALREEAAPAGLRILDAAEATHWYGADVVGRRARPCCVAATAGPDRPRRLRSRSDRQRGARRGRPRRRSGAGRDLVEAPATPRSRGPARRPASRSPRRRRSCAGAYHAVRGAVAAAGTTSRAHVSRFDADGAVLFFTFAREQRQGARRLREAAARAGGGWLLGARARELDPYLVALRAALDPQGIMNPGALTG